MNNNNPTPKTPDEACEMLTQALATLGLSDADQDEVLDLVAGKIGAPAGQGDADRGPVAA